MKNLILAFVVVFTMVIAPKVIGAINIIQKHQSLNATQVVVFNTKKGAIKW